VSARDERLPAWAPRDAGRAFASREVAGVPGESPRTGAGPARNPLPRDAASLAQGLLEGDRSALARAITLVESNAPRHRPPARDVLGRITPRAGNAMRIGISGVPGAGKSTFIEAFGNLLCDRGHRLAVLAVDPSSSLSGGSILGDKTRMEVLSRRPECFIRPSPTGGALGGVARKTRETMLLCEAAGHDVVLVETVGVGQSEIAVRSMVDCFVLLMIAGAGDELQGMKKGILEIADILLVNKADGDNLHRARATRAELERATSFLNPSTDGWRPPVLAVSSLHPGGLEEVRETLSKFFDHTARTGLHDVRRGQQAVTWWRSLVEHELRDRFLADPRIASLAADLETRVASGGLAPSLAAESLMEALDR
jgi:LAO/AO transport system kinase